MRHWTFRGEPDQLECVAAIGIIRLRFMEGLLICRMPEHGSSGELSPNAVVLVIDHTACDDLYVMVAWGNQKRVDNILPRTYKANAFDDIMHDSKIRMKQLPWENLNWHPQWIAQVGEKRTCRMVAGRQADINPPV